MTPPASADGRRGRDASCSVNTRLSAVGDEQDDRDLGVELELRRVRHAARQPVEDGGNDEPDRAEQQHRRAEPGRRAIEPLHRMAEAADERRSAEHQQHVADDRSGQRGLDQIGQACAQRQRADDQLRGIAERRVQQPADAAAEMLGQLLGGAPHVGGQRQDGEHRRAEDRDVTLRRQQLEADRRPARTPSSRSRP